MQQATAITEIEAELKRLELGTDAEPYSGFVIQPKGDILEIGDDYDSGEIHKPDAFLARLRELQPGGDNEAMFEIVWNLILELEN